MKTHVESAYINAQRVLFAHKVKKIRRRVLWITPLVWGILLFGAKLIVTNEHLVVIQIELSICAFFVLFFLGFLYPATLLGFPTENRFRRDAETFIADKKVQIACIKESRQCARNDLRRHNPTEEASLHAEAQRCNEKIKQIEGEISLIEDALKEI